LASAHGPSTSSGHASVSGAPAGIDLTAAQGGAGQSSSSAKADGDKGEHLDLTCWDSDPSTQASIVCQWHPATRKDFGGYKLMRTQAGPAGAAAAAAGVFQSTTRSTNSFTDTTASFNVTYTYQLDVLDSTGKTVVRSEPQTVTDKPATDEPETKVRRLDFDCWDHNNLPKALHPAGTDPNKCAWKAVDRDDFGSFRITRRVVGSTQASAIVFTTADKDVTTFLDTTARRGVKYQYTLEELDPKGNVIGRSSDVAPHAA
jgi:hypothetical protein